MGVVMVMVEVMEDMVDTGAMQDMAIDHMVMVVMAMEEVMEDMVDTEAMEDMAMARDLLKLSEDMDTEDTDMESKMLFHELITKEVSFCQLVFPNSIISIITAFLIVSNSK